MIQNLPPNESRTTPLIACAQLEPQFQQLADQVIHWNRQAPRRARVGVTSVVPGAGKTLVARNLAVALARRDKQKILLVFSGERQPTSVDVPHPNVTDAGGEQADLIHAGVATTQHSGLDVLANDVDDRSVSGEFAGLQKELCDQYDLIVIDLPTACEANSFLSILRPVDGILIVCPAENMQRTKLARLAARLDHELTDLIGLVMNRA